MVMSGKYSKVPLLGRSRRCRRKFFSPFALAIAAQIAGIPLLPVVLLAALFWLADDALGWRPFAHVESALAGIRA